MPPGKRGGSHHKKVVPADAASASAAVESAGRSKRGRASTGAAPETPGVTGGVDTSGRRTSARNVGPGGVAGDGAPQGEEDAATTVQAVAATRADIERLEQRVARIATEEQYLQAGGNLLDFLGGAQPGAAPAPALRGAAAASTRMRCTIRKCFVLGRRRSRKASRGWSSFKRHSWTRHDGCGLRGRHGWRLRTRLRHCS